MNRRGALRSLALVAAGAALGVIVAVSGSHPVTAVQRAARQSWGEILIVGDENGQGQPSRYFAELYDPLTNRFVSPPPVMLEGRIGAAAMLIKNGPNAGKVLVTGGINRESGALKRSELYDPSDSTFSMGPNLSADFYSQPAIEISNGKMAGWFLLANAYPSALYDPVANHFSAGPEMICSQPLYTATPIPSGQEQGKILFAGGDFVPRANQKTGCSSSNATELFDPAVNEFEPGPRMNSGRWGGTATVLRSGPNAGKIFLAGGYSGHLEPGEYPVALVPLASTEIYDPATNTFVPPSKTPTLITPRADHTATLITLGPNAGKILIAGGQQGGRTTLSSTELYDPESNRFAAGPNLLSARTQHIAIAIPFGPEAGKILIAAGVLKDEYDWNQCFEVNLCPSTALDSTELYDPIANRFIPGPRMHGAPGQAVAIQLPAAPPGP